MEAEECWDRMQGLYQGPMSWVYPGKTSLLPHQGK